MKTAAAIAGVYYWSPSSAYGKADCRLASWYPDETQVDGSYYYALWMMGCTPELGLGD